MTEAVVGGAMKMIGGVGVHQLRVLVLEGVCPLGMKVLMGAAVATDHQLLDLFHLVVPVLVLAVHRKSQMK